MQLPGSLVGTHMAHAGGKGVSMRYGLIVVVAAGSVFASTGVSDGTKQYEAKGDQAARSFDTRQALAMYKKAQNESPEQYEVMAKLAAAYTDVGEDLGSSPEAVDMFLKGYDNAEKLVEMYPDSSMGYFFKALIAGALVEKVVNKDKVRLSRIIDANARKAIELDPDFAPSYIVLGAYYREVETVSGFTRKMAEMMYGEIPAAGMKESRRLLKQSVTLDPTSIHAHYELAKTCKVMGEQKTAEKHFKRALQLPVNDHRHPYIQKQARKHLKEDGVEVDNSYAKGK